MILTRQREITPVSEVTGLISRCYHLLMYLGGVNDCTSTKHAYYSTNGIKMQYSQDTYSKVGKKMYGTL